MIRYTKHPSFRAKRVGDAYYLRHENGARVRTDRLINSVWEAADGRPFARIHADVDRRVHVSRWLLRIVLDLLVRAGLVRADQPEKTAPPAPAKRGVVGPLVSIVIVNRDGSDHLRTLLPSIAAQDYAKIEVVMVDNGSSDDSVALAKEHLPGAKIVELGKNVGFAGGNNIGIEAASGEYIFLLNNDTELAPDCVANLTAAMTDDKDAAAVVPKMYFWRLPAFINAIGNSVWPRGWGSDNYIGYLDIGQFDRQKEVFSACFGAVLIRREALDVVGLLDAAYKFYYEDADWSYRARLRGMKISFAPAAKVYHKFNASMNTLAPTFKWQLVIGNRLRFATKNFSWGTWVNIMRNYTKEDIRGFLRSLKHRDIGMAAVYFRAWTRFGFNLPRILSARRGIQKSRVIKDAELFKLWPELPPLLDERGNPILNTSTVRRIYAHFLPEIEKRPDQTGGAETGM